jgi:hypothetical protein
MSRTTLAGIVAGLAILADALASDGPWTVVRALRVLVAVAIGALGVWARDHARPSLPPPPRDGE